MVLICDNDVKQFFMCILAFGIYFDLGMCMYINMCVYVNMCVYIYIYMLLSAIQQSEHIYYFSGSFPL